MSFSVIEALRREVFEWRGMDTGGVLLGQAVPGNPASVSITGHQPFQPVGPRYTLKNSERRELATSVTRLRGLVPAEAVGYYRSRLGDLSLHRDDLRLIRSCLLRPEDVFLVLRPDAGGEITAGFFFWDNGVINSDFSFLEFPLDPEQLRLGASAGAAGLPRLGKGAWGLLAAGMVAATVVAGVTLYAPAQRVAETPVTTFANVVPDAGLTARPVDEEPAPPEPRRKAKERRKRERGSARPETKEEPPSGADDAPAKAEPARQFAEPAGRPAGEQLAFVAPPSLGPGAEPVSSVPAAYVTAGTPPPPVAAPATPAAAPPKPVPAQPVRYSPPKPARQVQPVVPSGLRSMLARDANVQLKLRVDEQGRVVKVEAMPAGDAPSSALTGVAVSAARQWRFEPARLGERPIPADVVVKFRFPAVGAH